MKPLLIPKSRPGLYFIELDELTVEEAGAIRQQFLSLGYKVKLGKRHEETERKRYRNVKD